MAGPLTADAIPANPLDSLMARLDRLDFGEAAGPAPAVLGREFEHGVLQAVSGLPELTLTRICNG